MPYLGTDSAKGFAGKEYDKLMQCTRGLFKISELQSHIAVNDEDVTLNRGPIDRGPQSSIQQKTRNKRPAQKTYQ